MDSAQFAEMTFADAAPLWLATKIGRKAERTTENDAYHVRCLMKFFGAMKLKDIHAGHLFTYQQWRPSASKRKAGPSCINHEMSVLQQMLKRAGRWGTIEQWYSPMPLPKKGPGRALEPNEEAHLFKIASSDTRWKVAYCSLILTNNTTAGPGEIRKLRLKDIDTTDWVLTVREGAKNDDRVRHIPLNDEAQWAMTELLKTAKRKGAYLPEHYLLPHRGNGVGDPTRPQYTWKKAWYSLRARASEDMPSLSTLRPYDLRHHAITRLLENPDISEQTVKDIAGHVSKHILERYSHIRMDKKRKALDALCRKPVQAVQNGDSADSPKIVSS
jgi:integrase